MVAVSITVVRPRAGRGAPALMKATRIGGDRCTVEAAPRCEPIRAARHGAAQ